jgi:hypothetical protein
VPVYCLLIDVEDTLTTLVTLHPILL